jgi:hypothetical protein
MVVLKLCAVGAVERGAGRIRFGATAVKRDDGGEA